MNNEIKDTLQKLRILAERGCGGEKDNAEALLKKLCEKHNVFIEDLELKEIEMHWFKFHRQFSAFKKLLYQCIYKTMGDKDYKLYRRGRERGSVGLECTVAQAVEIELDYEFYSKHLEDEISRVTNAFIQVNGIFPPDVKVVETEGKMEDIYLEMGIEKRTRFAQIGQ